MLTVVALIAPIPTLASRIVLGQHYLIDIAAAVLLTTGVGLVTMLALCLDANPRPLGPVL
ncbi:hypothetical protein F5X71_14485 [Nocardia brasiliensis]|uniref:PAP2 superfamily n=1 Tax=Nocardia brasiliensis TaxID=37326 RepID=A0A6G9XR23_NOCBR|nr:hypothetical protein [Nocardia brasiliensis]QIS03367.1 hypothetical protein F5X71_14485 [Nocardia brasiliensis]